MPTVLLLGSVVVDAVGYTAPAIVNFDAVTALDVVGSGLGTLERKAIAQALSVGAPLWDHAQQRANRTVSGRSGSTAVYTAVTGSFAAGSRAVLLNSAVTVDQVAYAANQVVVFDRPTADDIVASKLGTDASRDITLGVSAGDTQINHLAGLVNRVVSGRTGVVIPPPPTPVLGTLGIGVSLQVGVAVSNVAITGATNGSTITGSIPGVTINSGARTLSGTPTSAGPYGLTETLVGATGSPKTTAVTVIPAILAAKLYGHNLGPRVVDTPNFPLLNDWVHMGMWEIAGGAYAYDGNSQPYNPVAAGINDPFKRLLQYPSDATRVQFNPLTWSPHASELGVRTFVLPAGQDFTVGGQSFVDGTATAVSAFPGLTITKRLSTGQHTFDFSGMTPPGASGARPLQNFYVVLDKATFVSQANTNVSFRLASDTSGLMAHPVAVTALSHSQVARWMDILLGGGGQPGKWTDFANRFQVGIDSMEFIAELSNRAGVYPWVCAGYASTPTQAAQYVGKLDSLLQPAVQRIFFDPYNEDWNFASTKVNFMYKGMVNGRYLNGGRGPGPITAANFTDLASSGANYLPGGQIGQALPSGRYIIVGMNGWGVRVYQTNAAVVSTDTLPSTDINSGSSGKFTFVADPTNAGLYEYALQTIDLVNAVKGASPRLRAGINVQMGDAQWSAVTRLSFPKTPGGTDTLATVIDAWALADYIDFFNDGGMATIAAASSGSARVAALNTLFRQRASFRAGFITDAKARWQSVLTAQNLTKPNEVWCYEGGIDVADGQNFSTAAIAQDVSSWLQGTNGSTLQADYKAYTRQRFYNGASVVLDYSFTTIQNFICPPLPWTTAGTYTTFGTVISMDDTTSPYVASAIERGDYYRQLAAGATIAPSNFLPAVIALNGTTISLTSAGVYDGSAYTLTGVLTRNGSQVATSLPYNAASDPAGSSYVWTETATSQGNSSLTATTPSNMLVNQITYSIFQYISTAGTGDCIDADSFYFVDASGATIAWPNGTTATANYEFGGEEASKALTPPGDGLRWTGAGNSPTPGNPTILTITIPAGSGFRPAGARVVHQVGNRCSAAGSITAKANSGASAVTLATWSGQGTGTESYTFTYPNGA